MTRTADDRSPRSRNYYDGLPAAYCSREADRHHGLAVMLHRLDDDDGAEWHSEEAERWAERALTLQHTSGEQEGERT